MGQLPLKAARLNSMVKISANFRSSVVLKLASVTYRRASDFSAADGGRKSQNRLPARRDNKRQIPDQVYELFPVLKEMKQRRGGDLSGGQQQQLAIGRALVLDPKLLILDEPTEGIQPNIVSEIGDIIRKLNRDIGLTVLLVEQKLPFARKVGDRFCLLDRGRRVADGLMADLNEGLIKGISDGMTMQPC